MRQMHKTSNTCLHKNPRYWPLWRPCISGDGITTRWQISLSAVVQTGITINMHVHTSVQGITLRTNLCIRRPHCRKAAKIHTCNLTCSGADRENRHTSVEVFKARTASPRRAVTQRCPRRKTTISFSHHRGLKIDQTWTIFLCLIW